jgi:hypothetical protein
MKNVKLLLLLSIISCATPHTLTEDAQQVKVSKTKKKNCSVVGKFEGIHEKGSVDLARNQAVNMAAKEGATDVYFEEEINNGGKWVVHVIGYMCK